MLSQACAKLEQDSKCVDKCNGLTDYDRILKMTVNHSNPRYTYDRYCVERCPGIIEHFIALENYPKMSIAVEFLCHIGQSKFVITGIHPEKNNSKLIN